jgi:hypothetical protein
LSAPDRTDRQQPQTITTPGMLVPATDLPEVAVWLRLLVDLLSGHLPPASARQPKVTNKLRYYAAVTAEAARDHEAARHRDAAAWAPPSPQVVAPAQMPQTWKPSETITTAEAGILLDVTAERARQLVAS